METQNYYKDTCALYNRAYNVISMEEYKAKMIADIPKARKLIIWDWVAPKACYSNALFICSLNCQLKQFGEQCNYCEGLAISKEALNRSNKSTILTVHHSFIYSNKYQLYVDCTPRNPCSPNLVLYLISDVLKDSALQKFIDSLLTEDEDGEDMWVARFIHDDIPLGIEVPKDWIVSNAKYRNDLKLGNGKLE